MPRSGRPWSPALTLFALLSAGCSLHGPTPAGVSANSLPGARQVGGLVFSRSGALWLVESRAGRCSLRTVNVRNQISSASGALQFCPGDLEIAGDGSIFGTDGRHSFTVSEAQPRRILYGDLVALESSGNYVRRSAGGISWVRDGSTTTLGDNLRDFRFIAGGASLVAIRTDGGREQLVRMGSTAGTPVAISESYPSINSFDLSPDGKEMVFSALRATGFDAAIGSTETMVVHWIDPDPADEVDVKWAPRGHKVSLVVRRAGGNFIRTVHVPTSAELTAPFPRAEIERMAWDPAAERLAVSSSSPTKSDEISLIGYDGKGLTTLLAPEVTVAREQDVVPGDSAAILFAPATVRYGQRYPIAVFTGVRDVERWSDARGAVAGETNAGIVITAAGINSLNSSFWSSVTTLPWADPSQMFVITPELPGPGTELPESAVLLLPKPLAKNFQVRNAVTVRGLDDSGPAGFEMKSAEFIVDSLGKRQ